MRSVPKHWHPLGKSVTTFFDTLSVFFPAGERFFVRAVRARSKRVTNAELLEAVKAFCGQEGVHAREHVAYNRMLEGQGYPVVELERRVDWVLATVERILPKRGCLAATCALEHFTGLMALSLIGDPRTLEGANEVMADLWKWHAAEESEHKSVAFDVYQQSGGTYAERVAIMGLASVIFWALVIDFQRRMMAVDRTSRSAKEWIGLANALFVEPGGLRPMIRHYFAYYHPGFHPSDVDTDSLVEAWERSLGST